MQLDERALKAAMKKMGITQQDLAASEVIIKCPDREILIKNPKVAKVNMMGKESFQIEGDISERKASEEEDLKVVMEKAQVSYEEAKAALKNTKGDIAEAILLLQQDS